MATASSQLASFIDRILRMKDEADGLAEDIKAIYGEAKSAGFDKTQLGKVVNYLRQKDKKGDKVEQAEAVFDLYLGDYLAAKNMLPHVRAHTHTREDDEIDSEAALDAWAERVADRIDPALLLTIIEGSKTEAGRKLIMNAIEVVKAGGSVEENTQPHPTKADGSDLTEVPPANNSGQVADIPEPQPATAEQKVTASAGACSSPVESEAVEISTPTPDADKSVEAPASAAPSPMYAAPGVVTWESCPPEGVARSPYSNLFGTAGQDSAVIEDDLEAARSAPIVKIGNLIIDGWARYAKARQMFTEVLEDGVTKRVPLEYPVVQYDGTDPLIDVIKWNVEGRMMTSEQKFRVAQALSKFEPKRKADIYAAFELGMELVA